MTTAIRSGATDLGLIVSGVEYLTVASTGVSVPAATAAAHAVQLQQVSLYPTVASAATIDIFGAAGATINVSGTTTVTGITACTAAQVGSAKTIIPSNASGFSITASANLVVDGATSGTFWMPKDANIQIIATSTTTFKVTTIEASGTWSPNQGAGLTVVGAFTSGGYFTKVGNCITLTGWVKGATSVAVASTGVICSNNPFTPKSTGNAFGGASNAALTVASTICAAAASTSLYSVSAIPANAEIDFSVTYLV